MTDNIIEYINSSASGNFFLLAGPCVIEGEEMALDIAAELLEITSALDIPYVFKGSYRKANRSRLDSFTGIGDEKALKILRKVKETFHIPVSTAVLMKRKWRLNMSTSSRFRHFYAVRPTYWWLLQKQEK